MGAASVSMRDLRKLHRRGAGFVAFLAGRSFPRRFVNGCNAHHGARVAIEGDDDIGKHFTGRPVRDEIVPIIKNTARKASVRGLAVSLWPAAQRSYFAILYCASLDGSIERLVHGAVEAKIDSLRGVIDNAPISPITLRRVLGYGVSHDFSTRANCCIDAVGL